LAHAFDHAGLFAMRFDQVHISRGHDVVVNIDFDGAQEMDFLRWLFRQSDAVALFGAGFDHSGFAL
jgi:hypothetical protein